MPAFNHWELISNGSDGQTKCSGMQKKIIIITAPSGAGKTSIIRYLLEKYPDLLSFSISATTRTPRSFEVAGKDYYFISEAEFKQRIADKAFIEWEMVYEGKYYGTLKTEMERIWQQEKTPILDIDVKGAVRIQQNYAEAHLSIFIQPPSVEELKKRLEQRGTETPESLAYRIEKATYELSFRDQFDYVVTNNNLETACAEAERIIKRYLQP